MGGSHQFEKPPFQKAPCSNAMGNRFCELNISTHADRFTQMQLIMDRRKFLRNSGLAIGATSVLPALGAIKKPATKNETKYAYNSWSAIRDQFKLTSGRIHMSQMLLASHPAPVRDAIEKHRNNFDENPFEYWENNWITAEQIVCKAAANYLNADPSEIVLTDSTTMGLGILYNGLRLKKGDGILTTTHDHYSTEKSLEFASQRNGAVINRISLYSDPARATADEIVGNLTKAIKPSTRIIAATWVHSVNGMKLPIRKMADAIQKVNGSRPQANSIYFCVDGVHGFGVDNVTMEDLGCDFFVAGTHKWMFGPRGTGILWGKKDAWNMVSPTIPAFRKAPYYMWMGAMPEAKINFSDLNSPGGFFSYEHRWSLNEAFDFHMKIGKAKVEERTQQLSTLLKEGLKSIKYIKLLTPRDTSLSAGINCFEVEGMKPEEAVKKLLEKNILASVTPYKQTYVRLTPCIINTEEEVQLCIKALENINS